MKITIMCEKEIPENQSIIDCMAFNGEFRITAKRPSLKNFTVEEVPEETAYLQKKGMTFQQYVEKQVQKVNSGKFPSFEGMKIGSIES